MKVKRILKFYFCAERLNGTLDNMITAYAVGSGACAGSCLGYAEKICGVICAKRGMNELWLYLDNIICGLTEEEKRVLKFYGCLRTGVNTFSEETRREIKRVLVKFTRRARRLQTFENAIRLVNRYYCLM